jgi:hypothetical protein
MNGFTVNIADFRCRGVARATFALHRLTRGLHGPGNPSPDADWQNEPAVYDIGMVREAQRLRRRNTLGPINIEHKAKVLRFRSAIPVQIDLRVEEARGAERWSAIPNGPFDPPPAA